MTHFVNVSEIKLKAPEFHAGDEIVLSGTIYTARDAAHNRIFEFLDKGKKLPFDLEGSVIYYAGPTEAKPGAIIGSCGPTTASRMDRFTPRLLDLGIASIIAKGERSTEVKSAFLRNGAVYLCAIGGAGALASKSIKSKEIIAFDDLGCESIKKLTISDFSLFCAYDLHGGDIFLH